MIDSIEVEELRMEINKNMSTCAKQFTDLETKHHLGRLDKNNKIMMSSDTIYIL